MDNPDEFGSLFDTAADGITATAAQFEAADQWAFGDELGYNVSPGVTFAGPNAPYSAPGTMTNDFADYAAPTAAAPLTLDDNPEAALPMTYGDDIEALASRVAAALPGAQAAPLAPQQPAQHTAGNILCPKCSSTFAPGQDIEVVAGVGLQHKGQCPPSTHAGQTTARIVESEADRGRRLLAYADAVARGEQPSGPDPFAHLASEADNEMAVAAAEFLAKSGGAQPGLQTEALKTYDPRERQAIIDEGIEVRATNLDRLDITGTHYEALEAHAASLPEDEDLTFLSGDPNDF